MRQLVATFVQAAGVAFIAVAGFLIAAPVGFAVVGVGVFVLGNVMERN